MLLPLLLAVAIDADDGGCVRRADIVAAVERAGGIDVAERVAVTVADGRLVVEILLIGAPPLLRETELTPSECKDVPELVEVLLASQRAAHSVVPAPDPIQQKSQWRTNETLQFARPTGPDGPAVGCGLCSGPPTVGGLLLDGSLGFGWPGLHRLAVGGGYDTGPVDIIGAGVLWGQARAALLAGVAVSHALDDGVLSVRGLAGGVVALTDGGSALVPGAQLSARLVYGWLFLEVGTHWYGVDPFPGAWAAGGLVFLRGDP